MPPNKQEPGPVMDIQRPNTLSSAPKDPTVIAPANPLGRPATMEYTRPRSQDPATPNVPSQTEQRINESPFKPAPKPKKSHKGLWISLIILLFVGIGGAGAYYYFMVMNNEDPVPVPAATQTQTEDVTKIEATPEGVDATTESIDKSLGGLDDTADYNPDQVSDDSLGL